MGPWDDIIIVKGRLRKTEVLGLGSDGIRF
jgi:hypothetical protein